MRKNTVLHIFSILALVMSLVLVSSGHSFAAINADKAAIDADIAAAIATGVDAKTAAQNAVSKAAEQAFNTAKKNTPDFTASMETVAFDIMVAFGSLDIKGLDPVEIFSAAREGIMAGAGLDDAKKIGAGIQKAVVKVKEIVCLRLGKTVSECQVDYTPALEAYETPEGTVPAVEAFEESGPTVTELIKGATAEPPIVDTKPASSI